MDPECFLNDFTLYLNLRCHDCKDTIFIKTKATKKGTKTYLKKGKIKDERWFEIITTLQLTREPVAIMIGIMSALAIPHQTTSNSISECDFSV